MRSAIDRCCAETEMPGSAALLAQTPIETEPAAIRHPSRCTAGGGCCSSIRRTPRPAGGPPDSPEANVLVPVGSVAEESNTPTSKSIHVSLSLSAEREGGLRI
jgi:hypothetical protein